MITRIRKRLMHHDEEGITLVELIIYCCLAVVILAVTAGIFSSAVNTRGMVTEYNRAASTGQLIANSVEEGVRNASGPVAADGKPTGGVKSEPFTTNGQLMRARVAVGATNGVVVWRCEAWYYSATTHSVYSANSSSAMIPDPGGFTIVSGKHTPNVGTSKWILLGEGVDLAEGSVQFFGTSGIRVILRFRVRAEGEDLLLIPSTVVQHAVAAGGTGPSTCF